MSRRPRNSTIRSADRAADVGATLLREALKGPERLIQLVVDNTAVTLRAEALVDVVLGVVEERDRRTVSSEPEMTTTEAAEYLDVSRPFLVKLVKRGELPCRKVGTHHRIPVSALEAYRRAMFQKAREAVDEITKISQESGQYTVEGPMPRGRSASTSPTGTGGKPDR